MALFGDNGCHAWGCANHQGTLHAGYNVSSVTDNGTGDATFNFTTATGTTNYCCVQGGKTTSNNAEKVKAIYSLSSSNVRVRTGYTYYGGMAWYDFGEKSHHMAVFTSY